MPQLQQGAKMLGQKALKTGVDVAQDVLAGEKVKTAVIKRSKQALGDRHDFPEFLAVREWSESYKKKNAWNKNQFTSRQESESISAAKEETRRQVFLLKVKWPLFITNFKNARNRN